MVITVNRWSDVLQLVSVVDGTDTEGFPAKVETVGPELFANRKSAGSGEFYRAAQAGYTVDKVFEIREVEYSGERFLNYEQERFEILRTYERGEIIELICLRRDDNHGR